MKKQKGQKFKKKFIFMWRGIQCSIVQDGVVGRYNRRFTKLTLKDK